MLQQLTAKQRECLEHAARCRERAEAATDPIAKRNLLEMAEGWEVLAKSYGYNERLGDFVASRKQDYDRSAVTALRSLQLVLLFAREGTYKVVVT